jgi:molybdopterin-guanine dinucleotide biosynthesis protein A
LAHRAVGALIETQPETQPETQIDIRIDKHDITGLILAGGAARRMDGQDKGLLAAAGRPLVAWVAERLRAQVASLWISANRNGDSYLRHADQVLADDLTGFQGPLAGIAAGLARTPTNWLMTTPCDTPLIPLDLGERLAAGITAEHARLAIAADDERVHPLHALIPADIGADLNAYLAAGGRSMQGWLRHHRVAVVQYADDNGAFTNANTPDELALLVQRLKGIGRAR